MRRMVQGIGTLSLAGAFALAPAVVPVVAPAEAQAAPLSADCSMLAHGEPCILDYRAKPDC